MLSKEYLLERGYCCGHGCLMCPYIPKHIKGNTMSKEKINELEKRIERLETSIRDFMKHWGPDVQKRRDERDAVWDEMVRVVSIQRKNEITRDGDGKLLDSDFDQAGDL